MLDQTTLRYMEASRSALALALQLGRISRNQVLREDLDALEQAGMQLRHLAGDPVLGGRTTLFATPQALNALTLALEDKSGLVQPIRESTTREKIAVELLDLVAQLRSKPSATVEIKERAKQLKAFFNAVQHVAREILAVGIDKAPKSRLAQAMMAS